METHQINVMLAFAAGMLSFLSPCVLPLVPAYVGHLAGASLASPDSSLHRGRTLAHATAFVGGFSLIFILIWASIGLVGYLLSGFLPFLRQVGGVILILMGLQMAGFLRLPLLDQEKRLKVEAGKRHSLSSSFLIGVVFAAGWTPCIGPILAGIIGLASFSETVVQGSYLLVAYSAGLGVPFLLTALALGRATAGLKQLRPVMRLVPATSGIFLALVGILMLTNMFQRLPQYFTWAAL
jgi:cytochrome c-type biogenesis protein